MHLGAGAGCDPLQDLVQTSQRVRQQSVSWDFRHRNVLLDGGAWHEQIWPSSVLQLLLWSFWCVAPADNSSSSNDAAAADVVGGGGGSAAVGTSSVASSSSGSRQGQEQQQQHMCCTATLFAAGPALAALAGDAAMLAPIMAGNCLDRCDNM
jgi:hypothetical protein